MNGPRIEASSTHGTIRLYSDHVEIEQRKLLQALRRPPKTRTVPLEDIGAINYEEPGRVRTGSLEVLPQNQQKRGAVSVNVEYKVEFMPSDEPAFEALRDKLYERWG